MDNYPHFARRPFQDHVFVWDRRFAERQRRAYRAEDNKLTPENQQTLVSAFLEEQLSRLDPPQFSYTALRDFLEAANEAHLRTVPMPSQHDSMLALLDDRQDVTGWKDIGGAHHSARDWVGYADYAPPGESRISGLFNPGDLYRKLSRSVSEYFHFLCAVELD